MRAARMLGMLGTMAIAGCATPAPPVNLSGYPPAFREGYMDGCNSVGGKEHRDAARMKKDRSYAQGYHDGFDNCSRRYGN